MKQTTYTAKSMAERLRVQNLLCRLGIGWVADESLVVEIRAANGEGEK